MATLNTRASIAREHIKQGLPSLIRQRRQAIFVDRWTTGTQQNIEDTVEGSNLSIGKPFIPEERKGGGDAAPHSAEFADTASKAAAPFGKLVISSVSQTIFLEGARLKGQPEDETMDAFKVLTRNNWSRQQPSHTRAVVGHGIAFVSVFPSRDPLTSEPFPRVRAHSAKRVALFYNEEGDEWADYAIMLGPGQVDSDGVFFRSVTYVDAYTAYHFTLRGIDINQGEVSILDDLRDEHLVFDGESAVPHKFGVCPVVPYHNILDLEGNPTGEIMPIVPLLRRLDQDTFDRLIVQRFGAWKVRYIAGMAKPQTQQEERAQKLALTAADILIAEDKDTKFGSIDGTDTSGYISATDHDLRILAAVTQTPPHHLLGLSSNLQAEALAAAEAGLQRKSLDFRLTNSGSHEQLLRLIAIARGNMGEAMADDIEIRWRDTESRSLEQASRALATLSRDLGIPAELLWHRIPGWSDADSERATKLIESGAADRMIEAMLAAGGGQQPQQGAPNGADAQ